MSDQMELSLETLEFPIASRIYNSFVDAIKASGKGYDTSLIKLEHRTPISGAYDAITITGDVAFRIAGKKTIYMYIQPKLTELFEGGSYQLSGTKSSSWQRVPAAEVDFTACPELACSAYDTILREMGFGCCSRYMECSDAGHCIHPDVMFAVKCAYRDNLAHGRIFYGDKRNI